MKPSGRIAGPPWAARKDVAEVARAFRTAKTPVRLVGGVVRDALLKRAITDVDMATPAEPEAVMEILTEADIRAVPTGIAHGTITAVIDGLHVEITTLRHDVETFGRHARVAYTDDWEADAARRDFTMNALYADPDGTLYDPQSGRDDLEAGRVRFVGDPEQRIREDVLRVLRFFRFHAHYGKGAPDGAALAACAQLADLLPTLSGERIAGELLKLLSAGDPSPTIALMAKAGVLGHLLPQARDGEKLANLVAIEPTADPLRRLAALLRGEVHAREAASILNLTGAPREQFIAKLREREVQSVADRLKLSNAERERLVRLATARLPDAGMTEQEARARLYRLGPAAFGDLVLLAWAREGGSAKAWNRLLGLADTWRAAPAVFPAKGRDALELGVPPGPALGALLAEVEAWWIAQDFEPGREDVLKELARRAKPKKETP